jgi:dTMP kinase
MQGGTRGAFISFEGGDGAGKSTQIERLAKRLRAAGLEVVTTREPGGSVGAEQIRALLVDGPPERWTPLTEALLMYAARADHLARTINPARARGAVVLSDRFADSTMAYQGLAGELGPERVRALRELVVGADGPDLTLVLDAGEAGYQRARRRGGEDRFEQKGDDYQRRVRDAFRSIAAAEPQRYALVKADKDVDAVAADIAAIVRDRLGLG